MRLLAVRWEVAESTTLGLLGYTSVNSHLYGIEPGASGCARLRFAFAIEKPQSPGLGGLAFWSGYKFWEGVE